MHWVVGIDEAGYGPNLGPLVQAAVALRLPDDDDAGWYSLRNCLYRSGDSAMKRLLIDDSKKVHSGKNGFAKLELGVFRWFNLSAQPFGEFLQHFGVAETLQQIQAEAYYQKDRLLGPPGSASTIAWPDDVLAGPALLRVVHPQRFNRVVNTSGTKASVLAEGLIELVESIFDRLPGDEVVHFHCDRQGGRQFYSALVQAAFPDGWVYTDYEKPEESRYRVENLRRKVVLAFTPRADSGSVAVAVASMLCKYVREVCMAQFNEFWAKHVPGLKPTAGYPLDAKRFRAEIRDAQEQLGLTDDHIWRTK